MIKDDILLFCTNNLKTDMLKTICTALKHELVSSKPVKIWKILYFFTRKKFFLDEITDMCRIYLIKRLIKIPNYRT